jgi:hypothetical protein
MVIHVHQIGFLSGEPLKMNEIERLATFLAPIPH